MPHNEDKHHFSSLLQRLKENTLQGRNNQADNVSVFSLRATGAIVLGLGQSRIPQS